MRRLNAERHVRAREVGILAALGHLVLIGRVPLPAPLCSRSIERRSIGNYARNAIILEDNTSLCDTVSRPKIDVSNVGPPASSIASCDIMESHESAGDMGAVCNYCRTSRTCINLSACSGARQ